VIGGGINGVAIARECALSGKRTMLVEKHDFASGTTSRSTRIIHGGPGIWNSATSGWCANRCGNASIFWTNSPTW